MGAGWSQLGCRVLELVTAQLHSSSSKELITTVFAAFSICNISFLLLTICVTSCFGALCRKKGILCNLHVLKYNPVLFLILPSLNSLGWLIRRLQSPHPSPHVTCRECACIVPNCCFLVKIIFSRGQAWWLNITCRDLICETGWSLSCSVSDSASCKGT